MSTNPNEWVRMTPPHWRTAAPKSIHMACASEPAFLGGEHMDPLVFYRTVTGLSQAEDPCLFQRVPNHILRHQSTNIESTLGPKYIIQEFMDPLGALSRIPATRLDAKQLNTAVPDPGQRIPLADLRLLSLLRVGVSHQHGSRLIWTPTVRDNSVAVSKHQSCQNTCSKGTLS